MYTILRLNFDLDDEFLLIIYALAFVTDLHDWNINAVHSHCSRNEISIFVNPKNIPFHSTYSLITVYNIPVSVTPRKQTYLPRFVKNVL